MFATLGDYGYQMVTVGEMEAKPVEGLGITTIIVSAGVIEALACSTYLI